MRLFRRAFIDMERLRVEPPGEILDLLGVEGVAPRHETLADRDVLEILHDAAPARHASISGLTRVISTASRSSSISNRCLTRPTPGLLREARVSSTVARTRTCVPGRNGLSQRTSSTPGAPIELVWLTKPSAIMRISREQECQPDAASPPSSVAPP